MFFHRIVVYHEQKIFEYYFSNFHDLSLECEDLAEMKNIQSVLIVGLTYDDFAPIRMCDCELGHNGMGYVGRMCDC